MLKCGRFGLKYTVDAICSTYTKPLYASLTYMSRSLGRIYNMYATSEEKHSVQLINFLRMKPERAKIEAYHNYHTFLKISKLNEYLNIDLRVSYSLVKTILQFSTCSEYTSKYTSNYYIVNACFCNIHCHTQLGILSSCIIICFNWKNYINCHQ